MVLKKKDIELYFQKYITIANKELEKKRIDNSLNALFHASALQHLFNFKLQDSMIEDIIKRIATTSFSNMEYNTEKCIVLFDSICSSNIALSMQYLISLRDSNYKIIYVLKPFKSITFATELIDYATEHLYGVEVIEDNSIKGISQIREIINKYKPEKILLHFANPDVYAAVAFSNIKSAQKYYINHGDEQFWVGTGIADYVLEFRGMGLDTSIRHRRIPEDRCLVNPYFPILKSTSFQGFEFAIPNDAFVIFSGGRFVKVYSESGKFLEVIRIILEKYPNAFFIFAGAGDKKPMLDYIEKHGFSDRWKVIGYRSDLLEMMKNIDLYLGTYPQSGALMAQYAAAAGTPIVEMDTNNGGVTEDMLPKLKDWTVTMNNWEEYFKRVDKLITDRDFRENFAEALESSLVTEKEFQENLLEILTTQRSSVNYVRRETNIELRSQRLLEAENRYLHRVPGLMSNKLMLRYYPLTALHNILNYFRYKVFN